MSIQKFMKAAMEEDAPPVQRDATTARFLDADEQVHSRICTGCSCVCDDISYYLKDGRMVGTLNLCEVGWKRVQSMSGEDRPLPLPDDRLKQTAADAARLLRDLGPTLVLGADCLDEAAMAASRTFARDIQAVWAPWSFEGLQRFYRAVSHYGWATALLDEVRDQANFLLFWSVDPLETHHRHLSRYSVFARGRFTERGNHDRNVAAVARTPIELEPLCQQFFQLNRNEEETLAHALLQPDRASEFTHRDFSFFQRALEQAGYLAVFFDPETLDEAVLPLLFQWANRINADGRQRMVLMPLWRSGCNIAGFTQMATEQFACPWGADFSGGPGTVVPPDSAASLGEEVRSLLVFEAGPELSLQGKIPGELAHLPRVVLSPSLAQTGRPGDVTIPTALPGVETDGIFFRADGLPLDAVRPPTLALRGYPTVKDILAAIADEMTRS